MKSFAVLLALLTAAPSAAQSLCPDSLRIYDVFNVDVPPQPRNAADFAAALRLGEPPVAGADGPVQVSLVVGRDGVPGEARVLAARDSALGAATLRAVSVLRFTPAQRQGQPVAVRLDLPVTADVDVMSEITRTRATADTVGTYELAAVQRLPRPLNGADFSRAMARRYPPALRDSAVGGVVEVRFRVDADGTIGRMDVACSTQPAFNQPTLQAAQVLRFAPAQVNDRPVAVWVELPVQWMVSSEPAGPPNADRPSESQPRERSARP